MRSVGVEPTNVRLFRSLSTAYPITQNSRQRYLSLPPIRLTAYTPRISHYYSHEP
nr:MAG TPA: hypothetical protein [Caudoviricetes sp.]